MLTIVEPPITLPEYDDPPDLGWRVELRAVIPKRGNAPRAGGDHYDEHGCRSAGTREHETRQQVEM
jgi:hypothetical protein